MTQRPLNFPVGHSRPRGRLWAYALVTMIVLAIGAIAGVTWLRDNARDYVDTDDEWNQLIEASATSEQPIVLHPQLCDELRAVANGGESVLESRLPSREIAVRVVRALCTE